MSNNINDLITKYLEGDLEGEELRSFEKEIGNNTQLANEVEEQKLIISLFKEHHDNKKLKEKLEDIHEQTVVLNTDQNKSRTTIRLILNMTIAASIAILATFGTMYISGWYNYGKHVDAYTELNNKIDNLTSTQASIWEAINEPEENTVPSYLSGSSFVISKEGHLVTNYHVIRNVDSFIIVNKLDTLIKYKADVIYKDILKDIAILQVADSNFSGFSIPPYIVNDKEADLGEYVYTLGYSKRDLVFGEGSVSSTTGYREDTIAYQISVPVNPGNSGGPLLDEYGNLLGIVSGKNSEKAGATYAIKSTYLLAMVDSMHTDTMVTAPKLPNKNKIKWLKRKDQVKSLKPFIFKVKVYKSQE